MNQKGHEHLNLLGQRFGQLVVIKELPYRTNKFNKREYMWLCQCDCGGTIEECTHNLRTGSATRCKKCYDEENRKRLLCPGESTPRSKSKLYNTWIGMKQRCYNPNNRDYYLYGKRGISMCAEWKNDYAMFREWAIKNGYSEEADHRMDCSIDRIDTNKGYSPDNCRWTDARTQVLNRRNMKRYDYNKEYLTLSEISDLTGIKKYILYTGIRKGMELNDIINRYANKKDNR